MKHFFKLLSTMLEAEVDFVLVGGLAAAIHGSSMVTQDVDVCVSLKQENLQKLMDCLQPYNPVFRDPRRIPFTQLQPFKNIYLITDLGRLDCLGEIKGLGSYDQLMEQTETFPVDDRVCPILTLDALIRAKEAMGRERDLQNVAILREIQAQWR